MNPPLTKTDQFCPECGASIFWDPSRGSNGNFVCRNTMQKLGCKWEMPGEGVFRNIMPSVQEAILYANCYASMCEVDGIQANQEELDAVNDIIDIAIKAQDRRERLLQKLGVDPIQDTSEPDKVHVIRVQELRRSNASRPIPSRKPSKRGDRSTRSRKSIEEQGD